MWVLAGRSLRAACLYKELVRALDRYGSFPAVAASIRDCELAAHIAGKGSKVRCLQNLAAHQRRKLRQQQEQQEEEQQEHPPDLLRRRITPPQPLLLPAVYISEALGTIAGKPQELSPQRLFR